MPSTAVTWPKCLTSPSTRSGADELEIEIAGEGEGKGASPPKVDTILPDTRHSPRWFPERVGVVLQHPFVGIPSRAQRRNNFSDVIRAAGFHGDLDGRLAQVHAVVGAVVIGFDDVGAMLRQD